MDPNVYGTNTDDQATEEQKDGVREQTTENDSNTDGLEKDETGDPRETDNA